MDTTLTRHSRFLSLILRHEPGTIGLALDAQGWAEIEQLLQQMRAHGHALDRDTLQRVVDTNDKKRFAISDDGLRIRASQGHSVDIDLGLQPCEPPAWLYHGTVARFMASIRSEGLRPGERRHVHLSADRETAQRVGARRGTPLILSVDAGRMQAQGHVFYRSDNGVWLVDHVPPVFINGG